MAELLSFYKLINILFVSIRFVHCEDSIGGKTIFVSVLFRHGDRAPSGFYPEDPFQNQSYWPQGLGELSNVGKQQAFELGQWLRQKYDALLTEQYSPDLIFVRSSDVNRTLMSASCVLAGMYPPKGVQVWNKDLQWQPIPIHALGLKTDNVFTGYGVCPAFDVELNNVLQSPETEALNKKFASLYKVLKEKFGKDKFNLIEASKIYTILKIESVNNLTLPKWTQSIYPEPLTEAASYSFTLETKTKKQRRIKGGLVLKTMSDDMVSKTQGGKLNIHLYSGHEHNVAAFLDSLGTFQVHNPPFAACVIVELRETSAKKHVVTLFYRNSTAEEPHLLTIAGCSPACPLETFLSITKPLAVTSEEWDKECENSKGQINNSSLFLVVGIFNVYAFILAGII